MTTRGGLLHAADRGPARGSESDSDRHRALGDESESPRCGRLGATAQLKIRAAGSLSHTAPASTAIGSSGAEVADSDSSVEQRVGVGRWSTGPLGPCRVSSGPPVSAKRPLSRSRSRARAAACTPPIADMAYTRSGVAPKMAWSGAGAESALKGCDGRLAGSPRHGRRVAARPAHRHARPAPAHLELEHLCTAGRPSYTAPPGPAGLRR